MKYTLPFQISADEKIQTTYYLVHATNHPLGCKLMKDVMYNSGTEGRFGYLGPAEGQMKLEFFDNLSNLKEFLLDKFKGQSISFEEMLHQTCMETFYSSKHYRKVVRELKKDGLINIDNEGPRGGIKDDTIIKFPKIISKLI